MTNLLSSNQLSVKGNLSSSWLAPRTNQIDTSGASVVNKANTFSNNMNGVENLGSCYSFNVEVTSWANCFATDQSKDNGLSIVLQNLIKICFCFILICLSAEQYYYHTIKATRTGDDSYTAIVKVTNIIFVWNWHARSMFFKIQGWKFIYAIQKAASNCTHYKHLVVFADTHILTLRKLTEISLTIGWRIPLESHISELRNKKHLWLHNVWLLRQNKMKLLQSSTTPHV